MTVRLRIILTVNFLMLSWSLSMAQPTTYAVSGRVTDAATGAGIPFASIAVKGQTTGTTSNIDGRYSLQIR